MLPLPHATASRGDPDFLLRGGRSIGVLAAVCDGIADHPRSVLRGREPIRKADAIAVASARLLPRRNAVLMARCRARHVPTGYR